MYKDEARRILNRIDIIKAFAEGKTIQRCYNFPMSDWVDIDPNSNLDIGHELKHFRVAPEPKYRPYTPEEALALAIKGVWYVAKSDNYKALKVTSFNCSNFASKPEVYVTIEQQHFPVYLDNLFASYRNFTKDGGFVPCGMIVNESA
jgi:hypothetical protein